METAKLNKYFEIFLEEEGNSCEVDKKIKDVVSWVL